MPPERQVRARHDDETLAVYVDEWIAGIEDVTPVAHEIARLLAAGERETARAPLPAERPLALAPGAAVRGRPVTMARVLNPLRSEREAFRLLIYVVVVAIAVIVIALIVQALK